MEYTLWFKQLTRHLADYKVNVLGVPGSGYYGKSKFDYILPRAAASLNYMVDPTPADVIPLSTAHFLNSTQTLILNFFLPMIRDDYALLSKFVSHYIHKEVKIVKHIFDHAPGGTGTNNFDFYCADSDGREYFFEIKYSEKGIEKTIRTRREVTDAQLKEMFNKSFKDKVNEEGGYLAFTAKKPMLFMKEHYQVYRNLLAANAKRKSYCIFLTMDGNEETKNELASALGEIKGRSEYIKNIAWENAIPYAVEATGKDPNLQGYYMELRDKYLFD